MKHFLFLVSGLLAVAGLNSQEISDSTTVDNGSVMAAQELVGFSMDGMGRVEFNGLKDFYGMNTFHGSTSFASVGFGQMPIVTGGYRFTADEKKMLYVGEHRFLPKEGWFYLTPNQASSGLKMDALGKIRIMSNDAVGDKADIFSDQITYDLYPPYQTVYPWYKDAALTVRTNGSRSLHSVVTEPGGIEAIRSDIFSSETKPYTAYRIYSNAYSSLIFSVDGNGCVYSATGMLQLSAPVSPEAVSAKSSDRKVSSLSRISELNSVIYQPAQEDRDDSTSGRALKEPSTSVDSTPLTQQLEAEKSRSRIGLVAEELEGVIPEAVRTLPDGRKGILYSDVVSVLVDAMKELSGKVDSLQTRIAELENPDVAQSRSITPSPKGKNGNDRMAINGAELYQNVPNPFNVNTEIRFLLPETYTKALICIYNLQGSQVVQQDVTGASQTGVVTLQASSFAPGMYLYALIVDGKEIDCKRMTITN